jgi:LEA14-like dessication related protein
MSCISASMSSVRVDAPDALRASPMGGAPASGRPFVGLRVAARCVVAAMLVGACASVPRLETPKVSVDRVRIDQMTNADAQFTVVLNLVNPNDRLIAVDAIDADLHIEDVAIGTAHLAEPIRLPARGETTASLTIRAGWAATLLAVAATARRAQTGNGAAPTVRYGVSGVATLDTGGTLPFSRTGEFPLPRMGASLQ